MTENQNTPTTELDFDEWLAGGERTTHHVTLFGRLDLIADIEALEKQRVHYEAPAEGDESLGGDEGPNADLNLQIEELEAKLYASKREFRVTSITIPEAQEMAAKVREELKDEISEASTKGHASARETARLLKITDTTEIGNLARIGANELTTDVINAEMKLRRVAATAKTRIGGEWRSLTLEQVKTLHKRLGEVQLDRLDDAALEASNEAPKVTVPKS